MISNITWGEYLAAIAVLTGGYYLVIAGVFYRRGISRVLAGKFSIKNLKRSSDQPATRSSEEEVAFGELEAVVGDLKRSVLEQAGNGVSKSQLLLQLKDRLANYGGLRQPACREAVNEFIIDHAKETCGVVFSEGELDEAWRTLPR